MVYAAQLDGTRIVSADPADRRTRRPPTRADVARYAGVSTAVVSYVVNDGPRRVAPETAARVRAAIEILNIGRTSTPGRLREAPRRCSGWYFRTITNPFFAEYARALEVAAAAHGYVLVVANSDANEAHESRIVSDLSQQACRRSAHLHCLPTLRLSVPSRFRAAR